MNELNPKMRFWKFVYAWYVRGARFQKRVEHLLTPMGQMVFAALLLSILPAMNMRYTSAFHLVSFLSSLLLVGALSAWLGRRSIKASRHLKGWAQVGQSYVYECSVFGDRKVLGEKGGQIREISNPQAMTFSEWFSTKGEGNYIGFDRWTGYRRFRDELSKREMRLISCEEKKGISALVMERSSNTSELPQSRQTCRIEILFPQRGIVLMKELMVLVPEPLGLFNIHHRAMVENEVLVLPKVFSIPRLVCPEGKGPSSQHNSNAHGVGGFGDMSALRHYRYGDSKKNIYWRGSAKHDELLVLEREEELMSTAALMLDTSPGVHSSFEVVVSIASSLLLHRIEGCLSVDLLFIGDGDSSQTFRIEGDEGLLPAQRALALVQQQQHEYSVLEWMGRVDQRIDQLNFCVLVTASFTDEHDAHLNRWSLQKLPFIVIYVSKGEYPVPQSLRNHPSRWLVIDPDEPEKGLQGLQEVM